MHSSFDSDVQNHTTLAFDSTYKFEIKTTVNNYTVCHLKNSESLGVLTHEEYVNKALSPVLHAMEFLARNRENFNLTSEAGRNFNVLAACNYGNYGISGVNFDALKVEYTSGRYRYFRPIDGTKCIALSTYLARNILGWTPRPQGCVYLNSKCITVANTLDYLKDDLKDALLTGRHSLLGGRISGLESADSLCLREVTEQELNAEITRQKSIEALTKFCKSKFFYCCVAACGITAAAAGLYICRDSSFVSIFSNLLSQLKQNLVDR